MGSTGSLSNCKLSPFLDVCASIGMSWSHHLNTSYCWADDPIDTFQPLSFWLMHPWQLWIDDHCIILPLQAIAESSCGEKCTHGEAHMQWTAGILAAEQTNQILPFICRREASKTADQYDKEDLYQSMSWPRISCSGSDHCFLTHHLNSHCSGEENQ